MKNAETRYLVARTDRLGDVLLALPALASVRKAFPNAAIDFLTAPGFEPVLRPLFKELSIGWVGEPEVRYTDYAAALILHESRTVLRGAWNAGVPFRLGPVSKPYSWFFLNHRVVQHRSKVRLHEAQYNLELAAAFVNALGGTVVETGALEIPSDEEGRDEARRALELAGVRGAYLILHPGTGGSALNLSLTNYQTLVERLQGEWKTEVVLSCGPSPIDLELTTALMRAVPSLRRVADISLAGLREIFRGAELVVAPSTGPLHLAHYVGVKTWGLYAPLPSQRWERWSPWGGSGESVIHVPQVACPAQRKCLGEPCEFFSCLDRLPGSLPLREAGDLKTPLEN